MVGIIIAVILGLIFLCIIIGIIVRKSYITFVLEHSILISKIDEINKKYTFYPFQQHNQEHVYDNVNFYQEISEKDYLIYQLQFIQYEICKQIRLMNFNKTRYSEYNGILKEIQEKGKYDKSTKGYLVKILNHYENKIFQKKIQFPCTEYYIKVTLFLSKINGQIFRKKRLHFIRMKF